VAENKFGMGKKRGKIENTYPDRVDKGALLLI
jgi:hypothetical protein